MSTLVTLSVAKQATGGNELADDIRESSKTLFQLNS